jgi:hypothetical protein
MQGEGLTLQYGPSGLTLVITGTIVRRGAKTERQPILIQRRIAPVAAPTDSGVGARSRQVNGIHVDVHPRCRGHKAPYRKKRTQYGSS